MRVSKQFEEVTDGIKIVEEKIRDGPLFVAL
jgi:hypothetical protein